MTHWNVFQSLLSQLDHEDDLLSARTQWLVISQMLLFVAYFCIDNKKLQANPPLNYHRVVSALGMVSTIFILAAILAAIKVWVELRSEMLALYAQHSDLPNLPMRKLHKVGIGGALLCSVLLPIALLFTWSLLTFPSRWAAVLMTVSGLLFSLFVIGLAHEFPSEPTWVWYLCTSLLWTSLTAGIVSLIAALWLGARSVRSSLAA